MTLFTFLVLTMAISRVQIFSPLYSNNNNNNKICAFKGKEDNYQNENSSKDTLTEKQTLGYGIRMLPVSNDIETINFTMKNLFMISNNIYSLSTFTNTPTCTSMGMTW